MQRILISTAALLFAGAAFAQTSIKITASQDQKACVYNVGTVSSGPVAGQLSAGGSYDSTNSTSAYCGSGVGSAVPSVEFGPAQPLQTSSAQISGGTAIADTFSVLPLHAVSCSASINTVSGIGTGTLNGGASICSGISCAVPISFGATFTNTDTTDSHYNVQVTCTAAPGANPATTTSSVAITQPGHIIVGGNCPVIQGAAGSGVTSFSQVTGTQTVYFYGADGGNKNVDVTNFAAVFGTWPGTYGKIAQFNLSNNQYVSMQFQVPPTFMTASNVPVPLYGEYSASETGNSAPMSLTISTTCGDFSDPTANPLSTVVPGCYHNLTAAGGVLGWTNNASCKLLNNTPYFLNVINADTSTVLPNGGGTATTSKTIRCGTSCTDPIQNGPGTWLNYTPQ